jgi:hypothetical protein
LSAIDELLEVYRLAGEMIKDVNPGYQYDLQKYYPHLCDQFNQFNKENLFNIIKRNLKKGIKEGVYRKEMKVELIARMHAFVNFRTNNIDQDDIEFFMKKDTFKELFLYHTYAILNNKGREILKQKNIFNQ